MAFNGKCFKGDTMSIKIFADGADINRMKAIYKDGLVQGFTTNPSLMKKAGVTNYLDFIKEAIAAIPDLSLSFEVFADDFETMHKEAEKIASMGKNIMVKIPITNSKGESSIPLITELSKNGININVTAVFTFAQVLRALAAFTPETHNYISVFAGRIANTGVDPEPIMAASAAACHAFPGVELLWASSREIFNIMQAERCNCDIITVTNDILKNMHNIGKNLVYYSLETVQDFLKDSQNLGFTILDEN